MRTNSSANTALEFPNRNWGRVRACHLREYWAKQSVRLLDGLWKISHRIFCSHSKILFTWYYRCSRLIEYQALAWKSEQKIVSLSVVACSLRFPFSLQDITKAEPYVLRRNEEVKKLIRIKVASCQLVASAEVSKGADQFKFIPDFFRESHWIHTIHLQICKFAFYPTHTLVMYHFKNSLEHSKITTWQCLSIKDTVNHTGPQFCFA